jgi:hypothetical protein
MPSEELLVFAIVGSYKATSIPNVRQGKLQ